jgi:mono/diheme cytochrome c family protein
MTLPPDRAPAPANTIPFPLNVGELQEGWKILFFRSGRYQSDPSKSAEWNRGAYLAESLSDCGGCDTPRNLLGAEKAGETYAGAKIEDWIAPALTEANPSPVSWTQDELFSYLRTGTALLHSVIAGPMTQSSAADFQTCWPAMSEPLPFTLRTSITRGPVSLPSRRR